MSVSRPLELASQEYLFREAVRLEHAQTARRLTEEEHFRYVDNLPEQDLMRILHEFGYEYPDNPRTKLFHILNSRALVNELI